MKLLGKSVFGARFLVDRLFCRTTSSKRASGIPAALDILDQASQAHNKPSVLKQLAQLVGWK